MDVFEAIDARAAGRWFLDKRIDQDVIHDLIKGAARAPSNSNFAVLERSCRNRCTAGGDKAPGDRSH